MEYLVAASVVNTRIFLANRVGGFPYTTRLDLAKEFDNRLQAVLAAKAANNNLDWSVVPTLWVEAVQNGN